VVRLGKPAVGAWLRPLFEAFVCGCWRLYWTDDTLYWLAKPTVRWEAIWQRSPLHHDTHAALEGDIVNLYFWHGVMVPPFVIIRPDRITIARIDRETNAEVRRAMIERYRHGEEIHGVAAFIHDARAERLDHDERYGTSSLAKVSCSTLSRSICTGPASEGAEVSKLRRIGAGSSIVEPCGLGNGRFQHTGGRHRGRVVLGLWSGSLPEITMRRREATVSAAARIGSSSAWTYRMN